jgi:hypothetical protein
MRLMRRAFRSPQGDQAFQRCAAFMSVNSNGESRAVKPIVAIDTS